MSENVNGQLRKKTIMNMFLKWNELLFPLKLNYFLDMLKCIDREANIFYNEGGSSVHRVHDQWLLLSANHHSLSLPIKGVITHHQNH